MSDGAGSSVAARAFSRQGLYAGAAAAAVMIPSIVVFGLAFGVLAGQRGLSVAEAILMSVMVCAGTAQFAALQEWADPAPILAAGLASLALNSRYILLSAASRPWFERVSPSRAYLSMYFLYDTNWALSAREQAEGRHDAAHLLGGGLMCCGFWTVSTGLGHAFGGLIGETKRLGLDFVLIAFFATLMVGFFRGRRDIAVVLVAIVVAVATDRLVPGPWYMVAGAIAGSAVAAISVSRRAPA